MSTSNKEDCGKKPVTKREKWRHAFAIGPEYEEKITDEDEKMLDAFARAIVKRGMAPAAILWFTSLKPLNFIGASIMQAGQFMFKDLTLEGVVKNSFMPEFEHGAFVRAIEKRACVDRLITLIEKHEDEAQAEKRKARDERRKKKLGKKKENLESINIDEKEI